MMQQMNRFLVMGLTLMTAGLLAVPAAHGVVTCGGPAIVTKEVLTADLNCPTGPAVEIDVGGSLDMAGHSITTCTGCIGVLMSGAATKLSNGVIIANGVSSRGVAVDGAGSTVDSVVVQGAQIGFDTSSEKVAFKNCTAVGAEDGFFVQGNKNRIERCHGMAATVSNFFVRGNNHKLTDVTSTDSQGSGGGIFIDGDANTLLRARSASDAGGIQIEGNGNKVTDTQVSNATGSAGISILGNDAKLTKAVVLGSGDGPGVSVSGDRGKLSKVVANNNGEEGIVINGNGSVVTASTAHHNGAGIGLFGDLNKVSGNRTFGNGLFGISAESATNTTITKNLSLGNASYDLVDSANCGSNAWSGNIFGTSYAAAPNPTCIK